jgi:hypothetical protein
MTMQENDVSGVRSEPRGYTRTLMLLAALSASLTGNVIQFLHTLGLHL